MPDNELQLSVLQHERDKWIAKNFPVDEAVDSILGATEEIGELTHHYLKLKQGIRGEREYHIEEMMDAVADCVIFLAGVCSHFGYDYGELVEGTWASVKGRDWVADPERGGE